MASIPRCAPLKCDNPCLGRLSMFNTGGDWVVRSWETSGGFAPFNSSVRAGLWRRRPPLWVPVEPEAVVAVATLFPDCFNGGVVTVAFTTGRLSSAKEGDHSSESSNEFLSPLPPLKKGLSNEVHEDCRSLRSKTLFVARLNIVLPNTRLVLYRFSRTQ
jgi:hypothetical protein